MKALDAFQDVEKKMELLNARIDRATRAPLARIDQYFNDSVARYREAVDRALPQSQTSFERFQEATAGLDRHQFNRVSRVLDGWLSQAPIDEAHSFQAHSFQAHSFPGPFFAWISRRRQLSSFELYLRRAHEHPAVARGHSGRRLWFEEWRQVLLLAVADGFSFGRIRAAAHGSSPPRRRHASPWPRPPQQTAVRHRFAERLHHTIFTHGPTPGPLPSRPVNGGGSLAPTG
ncbi:MAG: hypothetical protein ABW196_03510 [Solirubrobacterales bacterium]